jgi:hypothetical protein
MIERKKLPGTIQISLSPMKQIPDITQKTEHHATTSSNNGINVRMVQHSTESSETAQIRRPEHRSGPNPSKQAK